MPDACMCRACADTTERHPLPLLQVSKEANAALLNLQPVGDQPVKVDVAPVLAIISRELRSEQEPTRLEALRWQALLD